MQRSILKPIVAATLVCGTLDILLAVILTLWRGREPTDMLRFVASGPFPNAVDMGTAGALLGLIVHYTLMAIIGRGVRDRREVPPVPARQAAALGPDIRPDRLRDHEPCGRAASLPRRLAAKGAIDRHPAVRPHRPGRLADRFHHAPLLARIVANASH